MTYKKELEIGGRSLSLERCHCRAGQRRLRHPLRRHGRARHRLLDGLRRPPRLHAPNHDYKAYTYARGRIPGGFFKREGSHHEKEILTSRLIDRPLRPSFTKGYRQETQIIGLVLSAEARTTPTPWPSTPPRRR